MDGDYGSFAWLIGRRSTLFYHFQIHRDSTQNNWRSGFYRYWVSGGSRAAFLGKGEGSKELGGIAAIFTLAGIIAAQYFTAISWYKTEASDFTGSAYTQDVKEAKEVIKQVPTGSDAEIRSYLVKQAVEDGDDAATNSIAAADINDFRTNEDQLPKYQALASGQMTEQQYDQKNGIDPAQEKRRKAECNWFWKAFYSCIS